MAGWLLLVSIGSSGCSTVSSYAGTESAGENSGQASGAYYLQKQLLVAAFSGSATSPTAIVTTRTVPDEKAEMRVGMNLSAFADDDIKVEYANGLLASVGSTNIDKTGQIAIEVAKIVGRFLDTTPAEPAAHTFVFDPYDPEEAARTNAAIRKIYPRACVQVELWPGRWSPGCGPGSTGVAVAHALGPMSPGIYYRRALPHQVQVNVGGSPVTQDYLAFANESPVYRVDVKRTLFVKRQTTIAFTQGELTSVQVVKDSEALAVAQLPIAIADAVIAGPVDALTQRTAVQNARANLYNARATALNAETALKKAQAAANPQAATGSGQNLDTAAPQDLTRQDIEDCREISADPAVCAGIIRRGQI
ncbi:hypothetical protein [Mesorhizobium sp. CA7]|uniref:hypothetical protein n=1 Tax=Mesorhizobium sp. CA7 TaxID=588501 RepID=UPI001CC9E666|nr:hypothetical protein [Mesorhizobium sp. CA7]MBZ9815735.1 hypothetical protein [Mesorhizobium sp. CA7]